MFLMTVDEKWKISAAVFWKKGRRNTHQYLPINNIFLRISFSKVHFKTKLSSLTLYNSGRGGHE